MKYIVILAIGMAFYTAAATDMVFDQLEDLKVTYQSFDEVSQKVANGEKLD